MTVEAATSARREGAQALTKASDPVPRAPRSDADAEPVLDHADLPSNISPYVVKSFQGDFKDAKSRLDIRTLLRSREQRTLFLRAFRNYQDRPAASPSSYYQLAGIHGLPYRAFDGVDPLKGSWPTVVDPASTRFGGYCQHGTQLFPVWHRPYVLMFEQEICQEAVRLAQKYTLDRDAFQQAAADLRAPYFDWAAKDASTTIPGEFWLDFVEVVMEDGTTQKIQNPLASFTIPEDINLYQQGPNNTLQAINKNKPLVSPVTVRHPKPAPAKPGKPGPQWASDAASFSETLQVNLDCLRQGVCGVLLTPAASNWVCFSNHSAKGGGITCQEQGSLEGVHDLMHNIMAGHYIKGKYRKATDGPNSDVAGHIGDPDYAAMDPIFWLHHCNVDRLMALWESLHPGGEIDPDYDEVDSGGTFTNPPAPARPTPARGKPMGTTSVSQPAMKPLPLAEHWDDSSPQYPFRIEAAPERFWEPKDVLIKYHGTSTRFLGYYYPELATERDAHHSVLDSKVRALYYDAPPGAPLTQTSLRFQGLSRHLDDRSFMMQVFLKRPQEPEHVLDAEHYVGAVAVFRRSAGLQCQNCLDRPDNIMGDVPLDAAMRRLTINPDDLKSKDQAQSLVKVVLVGSTPSGVGPRAAAVGQPPQDNTVQTGDLYISVKQLGRSSGSDSRRSRPSALIPDEEPAFIPIGTMRAQRV